MSEGADDDSGRKENGKVGDTEMRPEDITVKPLEMEEWLFEQLWAAYMLARRNKRATADEQKFEYSAPENIKTLTQDIMNRRYKPGRGIAFITHRPVIREIFAAPFRDRLVHHFLFNMNADWWDRRFIGDSYSCRKNKGTWYGVQRLHKQIAEATNGFKDEAFIIKLDLKGYFMSLKRSRLYERIAWGLDRQFPEGGEIYKVCKYLWNEVIFDDPTKNVTRRDSLRAWDDLPDSKSLFCQPPGQGIVIGNLSSQLLSNIYLDQLDRYVKYDLGYKWYGRYVDDFYIIVRPERYEQALKDIDAIEGFLMMIELILHDKKRYIQPVSHGVPFLGTVVYPGRIYPGERIIKNFRQALKHYNEEKVDADVIISFVGQMKHVKGQKLKYKLLEEAGWNYARTESGLIVV
ncbi:RNA-directed DNA polymerase [Candidatus Saccharibacteria bacterium]|nr:RNA-directed DNA polymerase [Candidatus Saccharibacteria bacterium]